MLSAKLSDDEREILIQDSVDIGFNGCRISACIFVHMDGEHRVLLRIGIEHFSTVVNDGRRILTPTCRVNDKGMIQARITQLRNGLLVAIGPTGSIPSSIPFVGNIDDNAVLFADERAFDADPVVHCVVQMAISLFCSQRLMIFFTVFTSSSDHFLPSDSTIRTVLAPVLAIAERAVES
ncbi:hypothetical protein D3C76_1236800 [compost metagenome]